MYKSRVLLRSRLSRLSVTTAVVQWSGLVLRNVVVVVVAVVVLLFRLSCMVVAELLLNCFV